MCQLSQQNCFGYLFSTILHRKYCTIVIIAPVNYFLETSTRKIWPCEGIQCRSCLVIALHRALLGCCTLTGSRRLTWAFGGGPLSALGQRKGGSICICLKASLLADAPHTTAQQASLACCTWTARVVTLDSIVVRQHCLLRLVTWAQKACMLDVRC